MAPLMDRSKLPQDVVREFRRCTQGNAMLDYELGEYKRLFEEDDNMDKTYKALLLSLFSLGPEELHQTENENPSEERKQNLASGSGKDIQVGKPNDSKADEQRNVVSKKTKRGVLRKRASSEFRNVDVMEEIPEEDERVVFRKRSTRGSRKAIIEESTESDDSRISIIEIPSSSDEERDESDHADTDYYDFFDDDCHKSKDSDMDMMKPRRSPKGRFAPKSRDVGESSRVAPARSEVEFRRRVLEIISEPYDMVEYMITKKEFDSKRFTDEHPELGNELMKWRDNRRKQLALMRGFYFWRQNLTQEGAFKPWRDDVCLAVEAQPSHGGNESEN